MAVTAADAANCNLGVAEGCAGVDVGELPAVDTAGAASPFGSSPPDHQVAATTAVTAATAMSHMRWDIQYGQFCW
jgi:hypothetical protein